jgi:transketolase
MVSETMREAFARTAGALVDEDPRTAIVLAEISTDHFADARRRHPDRVVNVGIMEQTMVGVAAGFAIEGFHPIAHSLSPFMAERPYEQLKLDFGYQGLGGTFVGTGGSYDYAAEGGTHHAPADASLMLAIPRMEVLVPGHPAEVEPLLRATYADGSPTYLRIGAAANAEPRDVAPGRVEVVRRGSSGLAILAFGPMLVRVSPAAEELDATVLYATSLRPFDDVRVSEVVTDGATVAIVEPWYEGTATPVVVAALTGRRVAMASIGVPRAFIHSYGTSQDLDRALGMDPAGVGDRLRLLVA